MALRSNQTEQMSRRLKQDIQKLAPELTTASEQDASGNPIIAIKDGEDTVAIAKLKRRSFEGFNITLELDSSAGNGYPEHEMWLGMKDDTSLERCAKLVKACAAAGASELKIVKTAEAPTDEDLAEANVSATIPNDARLGSVGA